MGINSITYLWHSQASGLHSEAWHVGQFTGDDTERDLPENIMAEILKNMVSEGWDEEEAEEYLTAYCVSPEELMELVKK